MDNKAKKNKIHYAWFVVIGLGLMCAGTGGSFITLAGSFLSPVTTELNINITHFSYYFTIITFIMAICLPKVGDMIPKMNVPVVLTAASAVQVVLCAMMSFYTKLWMWLLSAVIIGVGLAFTSMVVMSAIIDNWFKKKSGLAVGICWSVNAAYLAIMSPILNNLVATIGWKKSYIILAVVSALMTLPFTIFVIRLKPSDKGMLPYGYEEGEENPEAVEAASTQSEDTAGVPFNMAIRSTTFVLVVIMLSIIQWTVVMNQLFPIYAEKVGFGAIVGGLMVSAASIVDVVLNTVMGASCDKFGAIKAMLGWTVISILSFVILIFASGNPVLAIIGAGVNDVMFAACGTGVTMVAMAVFGSKDFGKIFSYIVAVGYIVGSFGMPLMTAIYEKFNSFNAVFIFCIMINVIVIVLLFLINGSGKKLRMKAAAVETTK